MHDSVLFQAGIFPPKGAARAHVVGHVKTAHPIFVGRIQGNYSWKKKSWGSLHMPPVAFQTITIFT